MNLLKDLPELLKAEVINRETADRIREYYENRGRSSANRLFMVFGILGATLVGLGIILIIAHNWDEFPRTVKTLFAFLPLLAGQILCGYVLVNKRESTAWKESGATFLFFAVGAGISLVSQIYHIPGNLGSFLLTWSLLCLPLIYVMRSSMASLLYIIGITWYACETTYWSYPSSDSYTYWILLLGAFPHYYRLYRKSPESNFMIFHNWAIPLSVVITLGTVAGGADELMYIAYFSLFGILYLAGDLEFFTRQRPGNNGYRILGSLGTIVLLLILSFDWFWTDLRKEGFLFTEIMASPEFFAAAVMTLLAGSLFYFRQKGRPLAGIRPLAPVFILFIVTFIIGLFSPVAVVLVNLYVLAIGILTIREGARQDHLGKLNYGLMVITALVVCRFFDTDLSFVIRGILFMAVGAGFFAANYRMLKKRKTHG